MTTWCCFKGVGPLLPMFTQSTEALFSLLSAVPELAPTPYILVGHSAGGQLAMNFAAIHRDKVAGLTLLDRCVQATQFYLANSTGCIKQAGCGSVVHAHTAPSAFCRSSATDCQLPTGNPCCCAA